MTAATEHAESRTFGAADCTCELYDDGDPENGPHLAVELSASCPRHGRGSTFADWANVTYDEGSETMSEQTTTPRYPDVQVELIGHDGNAFAVLGRVTSALRAAGVPKDERDAFTNEATSGDYDHLLRTCMLWVDVT